MARPVFLRHLIDADTFGFRYVEIGARANLQTSGGSDEIPVNRVGIAQITDRQGAAGAMKGFIHCGVAVQFRAAEIGQHILISPSGTARSRPAVVIGAVAPDVDHAVDRRTAAQHLATWHGDNPATQPRLRCRFEQPVVTRVFGQPDHPQRNADQRAAVAPPGFDQAHPDCGISAQPVGQHRSGRAGPHDHIVKVPAGGHRPHLVWRFERQRPATPLDPVAIGHGLRPWPMQ